MSILHTADSVVHIVLGHPAVAQLAEVAEAVWAMEWSFAAN